MSVRLSRESERTSLTLEVVGKEHKEEKRPCFVILTPGDCFDPVHTFTNTPHILRKNAKIIKFAESDLRIGCLPESCIASLFTPDVIHTLCTRPPSSLGESKTSKSHGEDIDSCITHVIRLSKLMGIILGSMILPPTLGHIQVCRFIVKPGKLAKAWKYLINHLPPGFKPTSLHGVSSAFRRIAARSPPGTPGAFALELTQHDIYFITPRHSWGRGSDGIKGGLRWKGYEQGSTVMRLEPHLNVAAATGPGGDLKLIAALVSVGALIEDYDRHPTSPWAKVLAVLEGCVDGEEIGKILKTGETDLLPRRACECWWMLQPDEGEGGTSLRWITTSYTQFLADYKWCKAYKDSKSKSLLLFLERSWIVDAQWPTVHRLLRGGVDAFYEEESDNLKSSDKIQHGYGRCLARLVRGLGHAGGMARSDVVELKHAKHSKEEEEEEAHSREATLLSLESVWRVEQRIMPFLDLVLLGSPQAALSHSSVSASSQESRDLPSVEEIVDALIAAVHSHAWNLPTPFLLHGGFGAATGTEKESLKKYTSPFFWQRLISLVSTKHPVLGLFRTKSDHPSRRFGFSDDHRLCGGAYAPVQPAPLLLTPGHPQDFVKKKLQLTMIVLRCIAIASAVSIAAPDPAVLTRAMCDASGWHHLFCPFGEHNHEEDDEEDEERKAGLGATPPWWLSLGLWAVTAAVVAMPATAGIHWAITYVLAAPTHGLGKQQSATGYGGRTLDRTAAGAVAHHLKACLASVQAFLFSVFCFCFAPKKKKRAVHRVSKIISTDTEIWEAKWAAVGGGDVQSPRSSVLSSPKSNIDDSDESDEEEEEEDDFEIEGVATNSRAHKLAKLAAKEASKKAKLEKKRELKEAKWKMKQRQKAARRRIMKAGITSGGKFGARIVTLAFETGLVLEEQRRELFEALEEVKEEYKPLEALLATAREEAHKADKEVALKRQEARPSQGGGEVEAELLMRAIANARAAWQEVLNAEVNAVSRMDELLGWKRLLQAFDEERAIYRDKDSFMKPKLKRLESVVAKEHFAEKRLLDHIAPKLSGARGAGSKGGRDWSSRALGPDPVVVERARFRFMWAQHRDDRLSRHARRVLKHTSQAFGFTPRSDSVHGLAKITALAGLVCSSCAAVLQVYKWIEERNAYSPGGLGGWGPFNAGPTILAYLLAVFIDLGLVENAAIISQYVVLPLGVSMEVHSRHSCLTPPPAFDPVAIFCSNDRFGGKYRKKEGSETKHEIKTQASVVIPVYDFLHRDGYLLRRIRRLFWCDPRPGHPRLARGSELSLGQLFNSLEAASPDCSGGLDGLGGSGGGFFAAGAGVYVRGAAQRAAMKDFNDRVHHKKSRELCTFSKLLIDADGLALTTPETVSERRRRWRAMGVRIGLYSSQSQHSPEELLAIDASTSMGTFDLNVLSKSSATAQIHKYALEEDDINPYSSVIVCASYFQNFIKKCCHCCCGGWFNLFNLTMTLKFTQKNKKNKKPPKARKPYPVLASFLSNLPSPLLAVLLRGFYTSFFGILGMIALNFWATRFFLQQHILKVVKYGSDYWCRWSHSLFPSYFEIEKLTLKFNQYEFSMCQKETSLLAGLILLSPILGGDLKTRQAKRIAELASGELSALAIMGQHDFQKLLSTDVFHFGASNRDDGNEREEEDQMTKALKQSKKKFAPIKGAVGGTAVGEAKKRMEETAKKTKLKFLRIQEEGKNLLHFGTSLERLSTSNKKKKKDRVNDDDESFDNRKQPKTGIKKEKNGYNGHHGSDLDNAFGMLSSNDEEAKL